MFIHESISRKMVCAAVAPRPGVAEHVGMVLFCLDLSISFRIYLASSAVFLQVLVTAPFEKYDFVYGLVAYFCFALSMLWWFWRPGKASLLFSIFIVCFVINGPGVLLYAFWGMDRYSAKLRTWFFNLLGL
jgi:hypothetical protein